MWVHKLTFRIYKYVWSAAGCIYHTLHYQESNLWVVASIAEYDVMCFVLKYFYTVIDAAHFI